MVPLKSVVSRRITTTTTTKTTTRSSCVTTQMLFRSHLKITKSNYILINLKYCSQIRYHVLCECMFVSYYLISQILTTNVGMHTRLVCTNYQNATHTYKCIITFWSNFSQCDSKSARNLYLVLNDHIQNRPLFQPFCLFSHKIERSNNRFQFEIPQNLDP